MTSQPAYDFFTQQPITTAIPTGASLFGSLADSQQNPVRFAPSSILSYVLSQLASVATSGNAAQLTGALPIASLPTRLQDIANIPPGSFTQGDLLYMGVSSISRLPAGLSGQVLQTQGPNQNPQWVTPAVLTVGLSQNTQYLYNNNGAIAGSSALTLVSGNVQFGGADAGTPVAQTLLAQSAANGIAVNTAGADLTFVASKSTGQADSGRILFQSAPYGAASNSVQNTAATWFQIGNTGGPVANSAGARTVGFVGAATSLWFTNNLFGPNGVPGNAWSILIGSVGLCSALDATATNNGSPAFQFVAPIGLSAGISSVADVWLTRAAAANLRLGQPDAAAPVAQTLSVQSVIAGTSNAAGVNWTFKASASTGNAAGGSFIFQVTEPGSSGTAQNAFSSVLTIAPNASGRPTFAFGASGGGQSIVSVPGNANDAVLNLANNSPGNNQGWAFSFGGTNSVGIGQSGGDSSVGLLLGPNQLVAWSPTQAFGVNDTFLSRGGIAIVRLGQVDAAAPVAQTLSVQSVVAGTSNTAGVDWTFNASRGTGTGAGGRFVFQTAAAGSSGTTQNVLAQAVIVANPSTGLLLSNVGGFSSISDITHADAGYVKFTNSIVIGRLTGRDALLVDGNAPVGILIMNCGATGLTNALAFGNTNAGDTFISRPAAAQLQFGATDAAAPLAQTTSVQSVIAGTSNTAGVNWTFKASASTGNATGGSFIFQGTPAGGSGTTQNVFATAFSITAGGQISATSNILTAGNLYFGGGSISFISSAVDGTIIFSNNAATRQDFLTIPVSATWQLGQVDAAAPVAQTLSVQSVVAGTSNTAGVDWTFNASRSTGTGAGGNFVFQGARAGGSGTTQNGLVSVCTMAASTAYGAISAIYVPSAGLILGTLNQNITFGATSANQSHALLNNGTFTVQSGMTIGWSPGSDPGTVTADTTLSRLSANCVKSAGAWASSAPNTQSGTTYTMVAADSSLIFTNAAAVTVTLLAASSNTGRWLYIKQTGAGAVSSASSNVVLLAGGAAQATITTAAAKFAVLQSDGTNWIIMVSN